MDRIIEYFFNFQVMAKYWPKLWSGFLVTLEMAVLIVVFGLLLGLLVAVIRAFQIKPVNWVIIFFVDLFRAVPALVLHSRSDQSHQPCSFTRPGLSSRPRARRW